MSYENNPAQHSCICYCHALTVLWFNLQSYVGFFSFPFLLSYTVCLKLIINTWIFIYLPSQHHGTSFFKVVTNCWHWSSCPLNPPLSTVVVPLPFTDYFHSTYGVCELLAVATAILPHFYPRQYVSREQRMNVTRYT